MSSLLPLLLASASPRRRQIITRLGLPYTAAVPPTDETTIQQHYTGPVEGLGVWTAAHKAVMALTLPEATNRIVIAADTTVILNGKELGKPRDKAEARELLLALRGRWHQVVTGVVACTMVNGCITLYSESRATPVLMRPYSEEEIDTYIATGDPLDKAGAYGIQHPQFQPTERIEGCYQNVVGLPLCTLVRLLAKFDVYPATKPVYKKPQDTEEVTCPWSERCLGYQNLK
jgi:septum formation protein